MRSVNLGIEYAGHVGNILKGEHRWIGRCKKCGATHKVEGEVVSMRAPEQRWIVGAASGSTRRAQWDNVIKSPSGVLYTTAEHGSAVSYVHVPCKDHWCLLKLVTEGKKKSKHECGARCTNATGPNCDCRCKGKNHGSNC